jgi:predicted thioesterase
VTEHEQEALSFIVGPEDTARAVGSGSLDVLGTPRLLAWCEAATCAALADELPDGETSVGTRMEIEHLRASPVGEIVRVQVRVLFTDGRLRRFAVRAWHESDGRVVAKAEITRVVVDADRFLTRLHRP